MKRMIAFAAPLAMALSMSAVATPLAAQSASNSSASIAKACNSGLADAFNISVGTCINYFRDMDAVGLCKLLKDAGALDFLNYRNQGQCIKALS